MSIVSNVKEIADLVKKYNDQELYQRIVELREEILQLREESIELREKVKAQDKSAEIQAKIARKGNTYVLPSDSGELGPYCMPCWDYDRKLVNLHVSTSTIQGRTHTSIHCNICSARRREK